MISKYFERGYTPDGFYFEYQRITFCGIPIISRRVLDTLCTKDKAEEEEGSPLGFAE